MLAVKKLKNISAGTFFLFFLLFIILPGKTAAVTCEAGKYLWCINATKSCSNMPYDVTMNNPEEQCKRLDQRLGLFTGLTCTDTIGEKPAECSAGANNPNVGTGIGCCVVSAPSGKKCVDLASSNQKDLCIAGTTISGAALTVWAAGVGWLSGLVDLSGVQFMEPAQCEQEPSCPTYKAPSGGTGGLKTVETNFTPIKPLLQINIPTVNFSDIKVQGETGSRYVDIPFLAEYIKGVFNYALGLLAMIAIIMIMIGGVKYIMARGGGGVGEAKKMIGNAVFGLILGLLSFVILNTVSPSLTNLSTLRTPVVETITMDYTAMENTVPPGDAPGAAPEGAAPNGAGFNNVPIFKQGQSPWGTSPYGDCGGHAGHASYAYSACGATSLAMVLKFYGNNVDPYIVGNFAVQNGYRTCGKGTNAGIMTTGVSKGWPNMVGERVSVQRAIELLKEGKPIVLATPNSATCYSRGGHYIVATGIDDQGRVRINDPATCGRRSPGPYNGVDGIWTGGSGGEGFIAMTQQKFAQAVVGWYIHPK